MNNYINAAFARMNLEQVCALILQGTEKKAQNGEPYHVQLKNATDPIYNRINSLYSVPSELTDASNDMAMALSAYEAVYTEIGMKAGARMVYQLLLDKQ